MLIHSQSGYSKRPSDFVLGRDCWGLVGRRLVLGAGVIPLFVYRFSVHRDVRV